MSNVLFNVDVARNILTENVFHAGIYVYAILPQLLLACRDVLAGYHFTGYRI